MSTPVFWIETKNLINRRWILASEPSPIAREDLVQVEDGLGWDGRITEVRTSLPFYTKIIRFLYRGNLWVKDILDVKDPIGVSGITITEARKRICRAPAYFY